jgi:hypothetical protein
MSAKSINRSATTQLSDYNNFDVSKVCFDEPVIGTLPGSSIPTARVHIYVKNKNKTDGDLIFALPKLSTYGIKESLDQQTKALTGYGAGLILHDVSGQSEEHLAIFETINKIVEKCKDHLLQKDVQKKCKKSGLERSDLKKMTTMSFVKDKSTEEYQMDKPVLNVKLIYAKSKIDKDGNEIPGKVYTKIYKDDVIGKDGKPIQMELNQYLAKGGTLRCVIKIESIFVGKDIKVQIKILEGAFKPNERNNENKFLSFTNCSTFKEETFDMQDLEEEINQVEEKEESVKDMDEEFSVPTQEVNDELNLSDDEDKKRKETSKSKSKSKTSKK